MLSKISVIVPVRNRENLILRALNSIINQSVKPYELIIVDNSSEDSTYSTVANWTNDIDDRGIKIKLLKEIREGATFARECGLKNAEGNYLIFFDSDDEMHLDLIEVVTQELIKNPNVDIISWRCRIHLLNGEERIPSIIKSNPFESHLIHSLLRPQGYIVRKQFLMEAGGWNKPLEIWNDLELGLRLLLKEPEIIVLDKLLVEIYAQESSITGKDFFSKREQIEESLREMEKTISLSHYPDKERILKIIDYRRVILAALYGKEGKKESGLKLLEESIRSYKYKDRLLLKFSYYFTRSGFRGAWRLIRKIY